MAKRLFTAQNLTWTTSAPGSAIGAGNTYMAVKGASTTQLIDVLEVMISGMASSSTVAAILLARASTVEVGTATLGANASDGPEFPNASALSSPAITFTTAATTQPTPSSATTDAKLNLALNLFGGIVRWNAAPTQQWQVIGNAGPGGESVLWQSTIGGNAGPANAHILYEPY